MQKNLLQLEQSGWWIIAILAVAAALTWWLYSQSKHPWNTIQNGILAAIRFVGIVLILFLLLEPLIRQVVSEIEKPIVAIAIDNSESVVAQETDSMALKSRINGLVQRLEDLDLEVRTYTLDQQDSLEFTEDITDISALLRKVDEDMEGRNWVATAIFTDGIYNTGSSPLYRPYPVPQFTVGLGDTIPPKDINISRVQYNRITYKGNDSPVRVEVSQKGFDGTTILVTIREGSTVLDQQSLQLTQSVHEVDFNIPSEEEGLRRLTVSTPVIETEFFDENNRSELFMEVIDGRQKILIIADTPHPDIKAIRSTLSATDNYQTDVYIPSLHDQRPVEIYDVIIYHGAFSTNFNITPKENPGIWYILTQRSSLSRMNGSLSFASVRKRGAQADRVTGAYNQQFSKFKLPENQELLADFPPLEVPFGDYTTGGNVEVLLYQRLGNLVTDKPLFAFYDDGSKKNALLMGQGIWKWKLQEAAINGDSRQFDELISKTVQYLSVKNDKRQFRFRARGTTFSTIESPVFDAEVYNDIYERIYGNTISLSLTNEEGERQVFEFVDAEFKTNFRIPPLASGVYSYRASTVVGEKTLTDSGQLLIENINREYLNLAADHQLLRNISQKTGGKYLHFDQSEQLGQVIEDRDFKPILRSTDSFFPLIENAWILLIVLLLFSSEWLLRKYWGGY